MFITILSFIKDSDRKFIFIIYNFLQITQFELKKNNKNKN